MALDWYANTPFLEREPGEESVVKQVRFRGVGDASCTAAVEGSC